MKRVRNTLAAVLAGTLVLGLSPAALAEEKPAGKEEVVYINLDAAGAAETVDVVNIFDLAQAEEVVDHGDYASVRNMTGTEELVLEDGTVTVQAGPGRLYYEGRLAGAECPWKVSLRYLLDGEERSADQLAGASGALEIRMTVERNPACEGTFFDSYALQASVTLDGDRCADIEALGATVANVGGDKQLTYTILPGMGADVSVTAQVTDFEMEPVAFNGVLLALDVQADGEDLTGQLDRLTQAVAALDDGAGQLSEGLSALREQADGQLAAGAAQLAAGAAELETGVNTLKTGSGMVGTAAGSVKSAAGELDAGVQDLNEGLTQLHTGLDTLNGQSGSLTGGSAQILTALEGIRQSVDQLAAAYPVLAELQTGIDALTEQYTALDTGLQAYTQAVSDACEGASALVSGGAALAQGSAALTQGAQRLAAGTDQLAAGVDRLSESAGSLTEGADTVSGGMAELAGGVGELDEGAASLKEGAAALREQTDGLGGELGGQLRGLLSGVTGGTGEIVSFASAENTDVSAVQFVLRTPPIRKPAEESPAPEPAPERTFWQKLAALF